MWLSCIKTSTDIKVQSKNTTKICEHCLDVTGQGLSHICTYSKRLQNTKSLLNKIKKHKEQIASDIIKRESSSPGQMSPQKRILLSTKSRHPLPIIFAGKKLAESEKQKQAFALRDITNIQSQLGLSDKQTLKLAHNIHSTTHRSIVEPNLKKKMTERNHKFNIFFDVTKVCYER